MFFISFIFSYILISFATATIFLNSLQLDFKLISGGMTRILVLSQNQHLFGIANGLADRIDRFLIGLILPISFLAKYALLSSIISFARFLPDAAVKLDLLRHHQAHYRWYWIRDNCARLYHCSFWTVLVITDLRWSFICCPRNTQRQLPNDCHTTNSPRR